MKDTGTGGATTVSIANGATATISTTNPKDYRRLLRRLTTSYRTVDDATHAEFAFLLTDTTAYRLALLALAPPEKFLLRWTAQRRVFTDPWPSRGDAITVIKA